MSQDLEKNKVFAAILVAGIVAMLCGFVARVATQPGGGHDGEEKIAIDIDTSALEAASGGAAAPAGPEPILALLAGADLKKGEALSKACLACHTFGNGEANKVGPNLYGIVNAKKAHRSDFAHSDAIKAMAAKGETWTYQNMGRFLWKPAAYAPGTKMAFPGLKKPQDRADVIAYLRTLSASPAPLPAEAEIAAEAPAEAETKEITDAAAAARAEGTTAGQANKSSSSPRSGSGINSAAGQKNKELPDEADAPKAARDAVGAKQKPATDARTSDQSRGDEPTMGKANPNLQPDIGD